MRILNRTTATLDDLLNQWGSYNRGDESQQMRAKCRTFDMACQSIKNKKHLPKQQKKYVWTCRECGSNYNYKKPITTCKCGKKNFAKEIKKRLTWLSNRETKAAGRSWVLDHDPNNAMVILNAVINNDFPQKWQAVIYLRFGTQKKYTNKQIAVELDLRSSDDVSKIFNEIYLYLAGFKRLRVAI